MGGPKSEHFKELLFSLGLTNFNEKKGRMTKIQQKNLEYPSVCNKVLEKFLAGVNKYRGREGGGGQGYLYTIQTDTNLC